MVKPSMNMMVIILYMSLMNYMRYLENMMSVTMLRTITINQSKDQQMKIGLSTCIGIMTQ